MRRVGRLEQDKLEWSLHPMGKDLNKTLVRQLTVYLIYTLKLSNKGEDFLHNDCKI